MCCGPQWQGPPQLPTPLHPPFALLALLPACTDGGACVHTAAPPASTITVLVGNPLNRPPGAVSTLTQGMGLVSATGNYVLYALNGTSGDAVVRRRFPDGSLGATVWQSDWPGALQPSGGSTFGESSRVETGDGNVVI